MSKTISTTNSNHVSNPITVTRAVAKEAEIAQTAIETSAAICPTKLLQYIFLVPK